MRTRLVLLPVVVAGLLLSLSGAEAATKTMDGKRVKVLTITAQGGAQDNDGWTAYDVVAFADEDAANSLPEQLRRVEPADCTKAPLCANLDFVYKPARGVKGGLMFTTTWANPASDIDIAVVTYEKDGSRTEVATCGGAGSASEKVYLAPSELKPGRKYALVIQFFRSLNETVTGKVEINVPSAMKSTFNLPVLGDPGLNCTQ
ncbi:MAG TPA: hypothetical protein VM097_08950 [Mycobacteriales bacterium]|nr:hypothetical protein [Mycobacteriales bacterium]